MYLARLRLRDFRNYGALDLELRPGFHLFLGDNAQGKSNVLESIYLLSTLRSFRGVVNARLVAEGRDGFFVGGRVGGGAPIELGVYWSPGPRRITVDNRPVKVLADFIGKLSAVIFSSEDLQLIRGSASVRRRFFDLIMVQTRPGGLTLLQRYQKALKSRNRLLKQAVVSPAVLEGFSQELIRCGAELIRWRRTFLPGFSVGAARAYRRICGQAEELSVEYRPKVREDFATELADSRRREQRNRTTLIGPHRDEIAFLLDGRDAQMFGSEGQKRSIAISLKMAQAEHLAGALGRPPVLLLDDVMGELDRRRRAGLLPLLERTCRTGGQVCLTSTEENWRAEWIRDFRCWRVVRGGCRAEG